MKLVAVDIGGTHARFALAQTKAGRVVELGEAMTLRTADHDSFQSAWRTFGRQCDAVLPRAAAISIACTVSGDLLKLTNNPWTIRRSALGDALGVDYTHLINDFAAVGHAVAQVDDSYFSSLCGPDVPLPDQGTISIIGPGTGLGVAHVLRMGDDYHVNATEGGHLDFAPLDAVEDALLSRLRTHFGRVSIERIASGPGLVEIYRTLAEPGGTARETLDDKQLWALALAGRDPLAVAALDRFCHILGSVAGDIALAQGGQAVVIAGGLGLRIADVLKRPGFAERFRAKGRFEPAMAALPVKLITHPQPGLFGAAAAFAREYPDGVT